MRILIVSATGFEVEPLQLFLKSRLVQTGPAQYRGHGITVSVLVTGVGLPLTAFAMGKVLAAQSYDLAINAGIAGALDRQLAIGDVVQVVVEAFADLGIEEADGRFSSVHSLGLLPPSQAPFRDGLLYNDDSGEGDFLPRVQGLSVNKVHGKKGSIARLRAAYPQAQVESMEGAAFFYACLSEGLPFMQIRAISNYVEARDREKWDIPLAIDNLNKVLIEMLSMLSALPGR